MSQIFFDKVDFKFLDAHAEVVLIVEKKAEVAEMVEITEGDKLFPPYKYTKNIFTVIKVLRDGGNTISDEVDVYPSNFDVALDIHRRYVTSGMSRSPAFNRYEPVDYKEGDKRFIIFLSTTDSGKFSYFCFESVEGLSFESKISKNPSSGVIMTEYE